MLTKTEADIGLRYQQIGERCVSLGVPESQWVWSVALGRRQAWQFLQSEVFLESAFEFLNEIELLKSFDQFFEEVLYHGSVGFESARQKS